METERFNWQLNSNVKEGKKVFHEDISAPRGDQSKRVKALMHHGLI